MIARTVVVRVVVSMMWPHKVILSHIFFKKLISFFDNFTLFKAILVH